MLQISSDTMRPRDMVAVIIQAGNNIHIYEKEHSTGKGRMTWMSPTLLMQRI